MKAASDLTLVLMRSNGAARTFRLPMSKIKREILLLCFVLGTLLLSALFFSGLYIYENYIAFETDSLVQTNKRQLQEIVALSGKLEKAQLSLGKNTPATVGFREDVGALNLFGKESALLENQAVEIINPRVIKNRETDEVLLKFDLSNNSAKERTRGYILTIAKSKNAIYAYPSGVLQPIGSVLFDYKKGETFSIARFRSVTAQFLAPSITEEELHFQILIFSPSGKILNSLQVQKAI